MTEIVGVVMGQSESGVTAENSTDEVRMEIDPTEGSNASNGVAKVPSEWNFIDFSKAERCPIFDVDPVMLKKFIGHNVTVVNSSNEKFQGCCLAIDPVSLSVILARRTSGGQIRIITLPGYNLIKIFVSPDAVPKEECVSVNDLDIADLYHARTLFSESNQITQNENSTQSKSDITKTTSLPLASNKDNNDAAADYAVFDETDIQKRKEALKDLLAKNLLPCTDDDGELGLPGGIRVSPPYTLENYDTKGNKIIQKKLGELIKIVDASCRH